MVPRITSQSIDSETLKAFSHPLRMRMFDYLKDNGPATASMLARELGESTGQTSYHLRQLERHGVVEEDTERGTARERWWKALGLQYGPEVIVDEESRSAAQLALMHWANRAAQLQIEWAERALEEEAWGGVSLNAESTQQLTLDEFTRVTDALQGALDDIIESVREARADEPDTAEERRVKIYLHAFPLPPAQA